MRMLTFAPICWDFILRLHKNRSSHTEDRALQDSQNAQISAREGRGLRLGKNRSRSQAQDSAMRGKHSQLDAAHADTAYTSKAHIDAAYAQEENSFGYTRKAKYGHSHATRRPLASSSEADVQGISSSKVSSSDVSSYARSAYGVNTPARPLPTANEYSRNSSRYNAHGHHAGAQALAGAGASYGEQIGRYKAKQGITKKRVFLIVAIAFLLVLAGVGAALAIWYNGVMTTLRGDNQITNTEVVTTVNEPFYVLLLGGDSRDDTDEDNRTDSIMVARVDEAEQKVSILSVPRDTRVNIEGHGYCKINSAIEYGGYNRVVECVNDILDIKINYYAFIYFDGFRDLVNTLGGVNVKVPEGTYYDGTWVPAGDDVLIDGDEALVLARCRHGYPPDTGAYAMGDYQRTLNQRNLIKAIAKKVLAQDATKLPSLISSLASCVETNMDVSKLMSLSENMKGMDTDAMDATQLGIAGATIKGEWYGVIYQDVYEVMKANFTTGKGLLEGLANYNMENNDSDCGSNYTDGPLFTYTSYTRLYGDPKG